MPIDVARVRGAAAVAVLALTPLAAWLASRVTVDNRLERWVAPNALEERRYTAFRETFGGDEFIVVALSGQPPFAPGSLAAMSAALGRLEAIPGVARAQGIPSVYRELFGGEDPEELEREMTSTPFYRELLLSRDGTVAALLVQVTPGAEPAARRDLVRAVREAAAPLAEAGMRVALVGSPVLIVALDEQSARESAITLPLAVLGSLLVLAALLRSPRAMLAAAIPSAAGVVLTMGAVVAVGGSLNMLTAALPALLWVLGLSYSVHVTNRFRQVRRDAKEVPRAVELAVSQTFRGVTFSAITTALGFLSLLVAAMPPVRELGAWGAIGIAIAWLTSITVTPLLLLLLRVGAARGYSAAGGVGTRRPLPLRAPAVVIGSAIALLAIASVSIPRVRLESNPLAFLPDSHPVVQDYRFVGAHVAGFYTAEVVVDLPVAWTDPDAWPPIDALAAEVGSSPIVARVVSPLDLLRKANQWDDPSLHGAYRLPSSRRHAERLAEAIAERGKGVLTTLVAASGRQVRLSALVREMDERKFLTLVQQARMALARLPEGWSGHVTGQVLRLVDAQQDLVATQLRSLGLALVIVFAAVWAGLGSWRLTLVALPPNVVPIAVTFAAMAWLAIPLDAATVMVASVALGIAVDNTIHYLVWYGRFQSGGEVSRPPLGAEASSAPSPLRAGDPRGSTELDAVAATHAALAVVAPAITAATVASCTGFLALTVSSFLPVRYFGALSTITMAVALACHLLLTTAILGVAKPAAAPATREQR